MQDFFIDNFHNLSFLAVLVVAMLPILEAKAALPFGMSKEIWGEYALSPMLAFLAAFIGSTMIGIVLFYVLRPLCSKMKKTITFKKLACKTESYFNKNSSSLIGLIFFMSLPLPLTGVWTGAGISAFTGLSKKRAITAIFIGNLISTLLLLLICVVFKNSVLWVFFTVIAFSLAFFAYFRVKKAIKFKKLVKVK